VLELRRRRVFRALAGWGIFSFAVLQVVEPVLHAYHLPEWTLTVVVTVLGAGFPVTVFLAWAFDLTARGVVRTPSPDGAAMAAPSRTRLAGLLVALGIVSAAPGLVYFFVWPGPARRAPVASVERAPGSDAPSIAVLAFADLSPAKDQEYFADGISEEILNALARVKGLRVAGRTSSFHFKGRNEDLHAIGTTLGVANLLEGSVRKQGEKVRITAQLVKTADGFHLWSKTYDGDLGNVFELQERIARDITAELRVVLQGDGKARLVPVATTSPEAYALYLQASAIFNRRDGARFQDAIGQLEQALRLDPAFARAESRLAAIHVLLPAYVPRATRETLAAAERHARRAIALDPTLAEPHAVLGMLFDRERRFEEAGQSFARALSLDPDDVTTNFWTASNEIVQGYRRQGDERLDRVLAIDPIMPNALMWRGTDLFAEGDLDGAERLVRRAADLGLAHAGMGVSAVLDARGRREEAVAPMADTLRHWMDGFPADMPELVSRGSLGDATARSRALATLDAFLASRPAVMPGVVPYALLRLGEPVRALAIFQEGPTSNDAMVFTLLWGPYGKEARSLPQFPGFLRRIGLADVYDRRGPPDDCRRVAPGEYACP
jgi:TolB-like protein